ncbi:heavy metal translocating P-type ATPase [Natrinema pellirubrum DSM 15624]|uniref:Heavy metal translocating P-type ATPase n=1 Tax=Natrinema pellirubrum (strain DSM 15624 / CIP 106293 / JCM 10476 / NCIMB 786 / 157) TaxID=797303 RepID=L0JL34_NATP1|nr:cation-translocating P-type ATPase [Natrinema pellirubrum]AGB31558.1 heavy metal-translocating P-type ATPase, Cd/Co/Hg/Pb/Zn-transporting [Natrinema pellirubrum DSM 15624]ELY73348.1 heavy metal translocating P-type ATPase [Natrinema pellirubrum DSM 15624]
MNAKRYVRAHRQPIVVAASGLLLSVGWTVGTLHDVALLSAGLLILAAAVGGYDVAKKAFYTLRSGTVGINTLVTLAAVGAIVIGEYWEAAAVVFLFSLGNYLEARTMAKTRSALEELLELAPDTAIVRRDGETVEVPAREVEPGETVIVKPGAKVPVDGEVTDGESAIDQSPVTGESAPVRKSAGDEVYAGTINQAGALEVVATDTGRDTTLERIIRRVEEAQEAQAPTETIIERFARYYTPAIVVLAVGTYAITGNAVTSLTLLVIGCPGALVIGPPVSIVSAIGSAARSGVLLKGGEHLETAGKIDCVAFDKTGTLTKGEPAVANVDGFGVADDDVLRSAAIAEKKSEHHLADAILAAARAGEGTARGTATDGGVVTDRAGDSAGPEPDGPTVSDPEAFDVVAGKGVVARYDGRTIAVGNRALLADRGLEVPSEIAAHAREREAAGETAVYVALEGEVVGVVSIRDELRPAASDAVAALEDTGVRTVMLTGDNERTARSVAEAVGIEDYRAELLPEEKRDAIESLRAEGHVVAMVGDGINDAPSLATADVGVAMGAAGTDAAIETADMALLADDLERVPEAVGLSKATRRNVSENVAIAVATVGLLLAGVVAGAVHMAAGMLLHIASVLLVILNGMRLLRY